MTARRLDLIALGECMVELSGDGPSGEATTFTRGYGGDTLNAIVAASRLGSRCGYLTRVGDDPFGDYLMSAWSAESIDFGGVRRVAGGTTGLYLISLAAGGQRDLIYYRCHSAASTMEPADLDPSAFGQAAVFHTSGISQAISPSARKTVAAAVALAAAAGCLVSYDPNYRPRLWSGAAAAREAFAEILPHIGVALPSYPDETREVLEVENAEDAVRSLWSRGVDTVVVKLGAEGALVGDRRRNLLVAVPAYHSEPVVDSTGCGDAFVGAVLHGLAHGATPEEAARRAVVMAGLKLRGRGAVTSLPTRREVDTALEAWRP